MTHRSRMLSLLLVSQAICLMVGLWLQNRLVEAIATWEEPEVHLADGNLDRTGSIVSKTADADRLGIQDGAATDSEAGAPTASRTGTVEPRQEPTVADYRTAMMTALPFAFAWILGLQAIVAYLLITRMQLNHSQKTTRTQEASLARAKELGRTRDAIVFGLAKLAESRDPDTGHHLERIALYSTRLASAIRRDRRYRNSISPTFVRSIGISSALHDIGKVGVIDSILLKPGKLTTLERNEMQKHALIGGDCIRQIEQRLGNSDYLAMAREIALCHHERWDGSGYPANLKGEEIPLSARIVAIADVYDALASRRAYKDPLPHDQCVHLIRKEAGKHFDPHLVSVFLEIEDQFHNIMKRFCEDPKLDPDISRSDVFHQLERSTGYSNDVISDITDDLLAIT